MYNCESGLERMVQVTLHVHVEIPLLMNLCPRDSVSNVHMIGSSFTLDSSGLLAICSSRECTHAFTSEGVHTQELMWY